MQRYLKRTRSLSTAARSLAFIAVFALVGAGCTALASDSDSNGEPSTTPPTVDMIVEGNVFVDDVNGQFRVKLDDQPGGMRQTNVVNFDFDDGNRIFVAQLTLEAETGTIPWHTHPGPIAASVIEGELTVTYAGDCVPRTYQAGESFLEWGADVHMAQNLHDGETVVVIVAMGIPEGAMITHPVDQEADDWETPCP